MMRLHQIYDSLWANLPKKQETSLENCYFNRNYAHKFQGLKQLHMQKKREITHEKDLFYKSGIERM